MTLLKIIRNMGRKSKRLTTVQVRTAVLYILNEIGEMLAEGHSVSISGFGKFYPSYHESKWMFIHVTQKMKFIPGRNIPSFMASERLLKGIADAHEKRAKRIWKGR